MFGGSTPAVDNTIKVQIAIEATQHPTVSARVTAPSYHICQHISYNISISAHQYIACPCVLLFVCLLQFGPLRCVEPFPTFPCTTLLMATHMSW